MLQLGTGYLSYDSKLGPMTGGAGAGGHRIWAKALHVFRQLFLEADGYFISHQVEETRLAMPVFVALHVLATLAVISLSFGQLQFETILTWASFNTLFAGLMIAGSVWMRRKQGNVRAAHLAARLSTGLVFALCLNWSWAGLGMGEFKASAFLPLIAALQVVVMVVGLLCCLRLPVVAALFAFALAGELAIQAILALGLYSFSTIVISLLGFVALATATFSLGLNMRRRWALEKYSKRDAEIIKLLLHDMGSEIRDWMWETDAAGLLVSHSPNLPSVLHEIPGTLTGRKFFDEVFAVHAPSLMPRFAAQETFTDENFDSHIAGEHRHWRLSAKPLFDASGQFVGYRGVSRDVTAQLHQEQLISSARDEAQRANEAKSQFLAVISHELRTPINAIVGFSEVLSAGQGENLPLTARREYLGTILENAKHLQGLINDVLEATRMEHGNIRLNEQTNDVAELVEVSVKIVRESATQRNISVIARVIEDVEVTGDIPRLKQVLLNILTNAIKFSPEGGIVQVDMKRDVRGNLLVSVRDAGIGISKEDAERVFEPFVQVENGSNRRFAGLGLGLAIARRVARLHGGELVLNGESGIGTEALLSLPAVRISWPRAKSKVKAATAA